MKRSLLLTIGIILIFSVCGCSKKEKAAIKIGNIEISAKEFNDALKTSEFAAGDPNQRKLFLENYISRRLILQEAEKLGMDRDPQFLQSIQLFWEQSLLKLALARKINELTFSTRVDDAEVRSFYEKYKEKDFTGKELSEVYDSIKLLISKVKQRKAIQNWTNSLERQAKIQIDYKLLGIPQEK